VKNLPVKQLRKSAGVKEYYRKKISLTGADELINKCKVGYFYQYRGKS
jgi:hypothetical protein